MRVRISTTVAAEPLEAARRETGLTDSKLLDRALEALLEQRERAAEAEALDRWPYELDADVAWAAPPLPSLPYDGEVPPDVLELAKQRAASR